MLSASKYGCLKSNAGCLELPTSFNNNKNNNSKMFFSVLYNHICNVTNLLKNIFDALPTTSISHKVLRKC